MISLNQPPVVLGTWAGTIPAPAQNLDTLLYVVTAYSVAGAAMSSSNPLYNGSPIPGAVKVESQSPGVGSVYTAIWVLPSVPGGAVAPVPAAVTVTGADIPGDQNTVGLTVYDAIIPGTGALIDKSSTASGSGTALTTGPTGPITELPELILGSLVTFGQTTQPVGAPWTEPPQLSDQFQLSGYQVITAGNASYTYAQSDGALAGWAGAIVAVYAPPAPAGSPLVAVSGADSDRPGLFRKPFLW